MVLSPTCSTLPQDVDHFAEGANLRVLPPRAVDDGAHSVLKPRPVGHSVHHETGQCFSRIQDRELAAQRGVPQRHIPSLEPQHARVPMLGGRNHHDALALHQPRSDEVTERVDQEIFVPVNLGNVISVQRPPQQFSPACRCSHDLDTL
ncbi:hypothetical protein D3C83_01330 [compost metagenome]